MRVNVTDKQLLSNLRSCAERNLPTLHLTEPHAGTLYICGSGPSLRKTAVHAIGQDVLALNGAYKFLLGRGIQPKFFAMLDSRPVNVNFLETPHAGTLHLLASQCAPECFDRLAGLQVGTFHLSTPTTNVVFPKQDVYVGGGGTIGLTSLAIAAALGYRKVVLLGFDSSFAQGKRHVEYQPQNEENLLEVWVADRKYNTTHAMAAQTMDFFPFYRAMVREMPDFDIQVIGDGLFYDFITTNNNPTTRERELAKYASAYELSDYGMTQERYNGIEKLAADLTGDSWLDVSTGRGETLEIARKAGFSIVSGTETVDALLSEAKNIGYGILPNLSVPDKSYDVVSLIEVIEHLVPDDVLPSLLELTRIARKHILISAAVAEHWLGGVNLHPSAMPVERWEALFGEVWGEKVHRVGSLGSSPCWRVDL